MTKELNPCSAHRAGQAQCSNGFPQLSMTCQGFENGTTPHCCREEWCGWFYGHCGGRPPDHMLENRTEPAQ
jgi:hypothetical protein